MPLSNFNGDTFVAFLDISGFKEMMKDDEKAIGALNHLYQTGFDVLKNQSFECLIDGLFISDCGVLFVKNTELHLNQQLERLLEVIKSINKRLLQHDIMLTTSIAYGHFSYQEKIEFTGIEKNQVYGGAYVKAFFDNENGTPKIHPGQCRLVKESLPQEFKVANSFIREKGKYFYYYWNVENSNEIDDFLNDYQNSYNLKYEGFKTALKKYSE